MNNFIKLSELREKMLRQEEMRRVKGGEKAPVAIDPIEPIDPPVMPLHYGIIPPDPNDPDTPIPTCD